MVPILTRQNNDNEVKNLYHSDLFQNLKFDYNTPDAFNNKFSKDKCTTKLSLLHRYRHYINHLLTYLLSLNKNNEEFCQFLNSLNCEFDILVLSQVWSYIITMFSNLLPGYTFIMIYVHQVALVALGFISTKI